MIKYKNKAIRKEKSSVSLTILFSILIILFLLLIPFRFILSHDNYYQKHFEKELHEKYGKEYVDNAHKSVFNYLRFNKDLTKEFSQRDNLHMVDVRNLVQSSLHLLYSSILIIIAGLLLRRKELMKSIFYGSLFLILISTVMYLLKSYFDTIFFNFHKIFFFNDHWQMGKDDLLIKLYPFYFWEGTFFYLITISLVIASILIIYSIIIKRVKRKTNK